MGQSRLLENLCVPLGIQEPPNCEAGDGHEHGCLFLDQTSEFVNVVVFFLVTSH